MSISSITGMPAYQNIHQPSLVNQSVQQLAQTLRSGDITSAKKAYVTLSQAANGPSTRQNIPFQAALSRLANTLLSGDSANALKALQSLQQAIKNPHGTQSESSDNNAQNSRTSPTRTSTAASTVSAHSINLVV